MKQHIEWDALERAVAEHMSSFKKVREDESGFFRVKEWLGVCSHPDHNFPTHLYIPPGMGYKHVCPGCGKIHTVVNNGPIC